MVADHRQRCISNAQFLSFVRTNHLRRVAGSRQPRREREPTLFRAKPHAEFTFGFGTPFVTMKSREG